VSTIENALTYRYAYVDQAVSLCDRHAAASSVPLGPVLSARRVACCDCAEESRERIAAEAAERRAVEEAQRQEREAAERAAEERRQERDREMWAAFDARRVRGAGEVTS
jgi:hypothetical protein